MYQNGFFLYPDSVTQRDEKEKLKTMKILRLLKLTNNIKCWLKFAGKEAVKVFTEAGIVKFMLIRNNSIFFAHTFTFLY
jgi:hypothetical protein